MRVAVMQPYFFPYLGYFQLLHAADTFVFFDDVNFIKKGWINRNNILQHDKAQAFTIPLIKASQNKLITETEISEYAKWKKDFLKTLHSNYKKAPHFDVVMELIEKVLDINEPAMISGLAIASIREVVSFLEIPVQFVSSSELDYTGSNGQEKILSICKLLGADVYINPKNGAHLYEEEAFKAQHTGLLFLAPGAIQYEQFPKREFVHWLSVIDVLMFNTKEQCRELLGRYSLLHKEALI